MACENRDPSKTYGRPMEAVNPPRPEVLTGDPACHPTCLVCAASGYHLEISHVDISRCVFPIVLLSVPLRCTCSGPPASITCRDLHRSTPPRCYMYLAAGTAWRRTHFSMRFFFSFHLAACAACGRRQPVIGLYQRGLSGVFFFSNLLSSMQWAYYHRLGACSYFHGRYLFASRLQLRRQERSCKRPTPAHTLPRHSAFQQWPRGAYQGSRFTA
jgi:hypothetical protein